MSGVAGTWQLTMKTPIGTIVAEYTFTRSEEGLAGSVVDSGQEVALQEVAVEAHPEGERVTWRQRITSPMRLNLTFDVIVAGDELEGTSRAGRLPRSLVTGIRVGGSAGEA